MQDAQEYPNLSHEASNINNGTAHPFYDRVSPPPSPTGKSQQFGTIDLPCLTYVSPASHLSTKMDVGEVTCLHTPSWHDNEVFDEAERQPIKVFVGCANGLVLEYIVGHSIESADCISVLGEHEGIVSCIVSSKMCFYSASYDGTMIEWSKSGKRVHTFLSDKRQPLRTILALDDEVYTGSVGGVITAFHVYNRSLLRMFQISNAPVLQLCSYNKTTIVSGSADGHVILWQRMDGYPSRVVRSTTCAVNALEVHSDGYAFAATHANLASLPLPDDEEPLTSLQIKTRSAERLKTEEQRNEEEKILQQLSNTPECLSWDLTTGWKEHKFPADATCLILHEHTECGQKQVYLVSGHQDGSVRVWLTQGRSEDTITAGKLLAKWNNELAEAEVKLEELREIEEREANIALAAKNARRPYFGLSLLLTASLDEDSLNDTLLSGMSLLEGSSKPTLHRKEATPSLNVLFRNSVEYSPELLWSGLFVLNRHVIADEMAPSISAKDDVDNQREIIARIRERATEADRSITDLLAKGQLLKTLLALTGPVTALAAHKGVLFGACENTIAGWDLRSGRHRESFTNVDGLTNTILLRNRIMCAVNSSYGVTTWYSHLLEQEERSYDLQRAQGFSVSDTGVDRTHYLPQQVLCLLPDMTPERPCLSHSSPLPDSSLSHEDLTQRFANLKRHPRDTTIPLSSFSTMWNALEHCGVNPHPTEASLAKWMTLPAGCDTVPYEKFASCILKYSAR